MVSYRALKCILAGNLRQALRSNNSWKLFRTFLILAVLFSCRKNEISNLTASQQSNLILVANAGPDQILWEPVNMAVLDASGSRYPAWATIRYEWKYISGPSRPVIADSLAVKTQARGLVLGGYLFELTISIPDGRSAKDTLAVNVLTTYPPNSSACIIPGAEHMADFSDVRVDMSAINFNNKFYFVSGNLIDIYDPVTNTIKNQPLSLLRVNTALTFNGDMLFIAGGFNYGSNPPSTYKTESRVDIFDSRSNNWSTAELSKSRFRLDASSIGAKVFFAGGMETPYIPSTRLDIYDMETHTWSYRELDAPGIYVHAIVGDKLWLMTGDHVEKYDPVENKWTSGKLGITLPGACNNAIQLDNKIYVTGDTEVAVYDMASGNWSAFTLPERVFLAPAIACNHKLVFVGGMTSWFVYSNTIQIYDPATRSFSFQHMVADLYYESLLTYNNYIYTAGGLINQENTSLSGICRFRP